VARFIGREPVGTGAQARPDLTEAGSGQHIVGRHGFSFGAFPYRLATRIGAASSVGSASSFRTWFGVYSRFLSTPDERAFFAAVPRL
jgi:hypothetical protein